MYFNIRVLRQKIILYFSSFLVIFSVLLELNRYQQELDPYEIRYESVNIKNMTLAKNAIKSSSTSIISAMFEEVEKELGPVEEVEIVSERVSEEVAEAPFSRIWYLPTEMGYITQYPSYYHVAFDITSPRGMGETVYPVADGVISKIYTDSYGALIVMVAHDINGAHYTSQYVHLSSYAPGIYEGMSVSHDTPIGQMGTTGYSTGVHLHLAVLDCHLGDGNCYDLGAWYAFDKRRISEGFLGLGSLMDVPYSWGSR